MTILNRDKNQSVDPIFASLANAAAGKDLPSNLHRAFDILLEAESDGIFAPAPDRDQRDRIIRALIRARIADLSELYPFCPLGIIEAGFDAAITLVFDWVEDQPALRTGGIEQRDLFRARLSILRNACHSAGLMAQIDAMHRRPALLQHVAGAA